MLIFMESNTIKDMFVDIVGPSSMVIIQMGAANICSAKHLRSIRFTPWIKTL